MHKVGFPGKLLNLCRIWNNDKVKLVKRLSSEFKVNKGLRQGGGVVYFLFNAILGLEINEKKKTKFVTLSM